MSVPGPLLVPPQRSAVVDGRGLAANEWYEFFRRLLMYLQQTGVDPAVIADILARLDALEADQLGPFLILGPLSVEVQGTPANGNVLVQLQGDEATPPATYYYGTDILGNKGFHRATDLTVYMVDESGRFLRDQSGSLLIDGPRDNHNALNNRQGGSAFESYHTTQAENAAIVAAVGPGGGFVDIASAQTITGEKTFTSPLHVNNMTFSEGGGTGSIESSRVTGNVTVQFSPLPLDAISAALFRIFRTTNTTGMTAFDVCFGNGSSSLNHSLAGQGANSFLVRANGNLLIGTSTDNAAAKIQVTNHINSTVNFGSTCGTTGFRWGNTFTRDLTIGANAASLGGGVGVAFLSNATTAPTAAITGGMVAFAEGGSLKGMYPDGRVQTISATGSKIITVYTLSDLPAASGGVITLADNTSYYITTAIDVGANRIQCGLNNSLHGDDADNCSLTATGLSAATAFITSTSSLSLMNITIKDVGTGLNLNDSTNQLNWRSVRFQNIPTMGTIQNYANIVWGQCILDNSANLTIQGTIGSLAFFECLFDGRTGQTTLTVPSTAVITRRIRMLYCAAIVQAGETGFNVSTSATIPDEGYVLDNVAFSGGGTYLAGLDYTSNKALFFNSSGIINSSALCQYSMTGNATATTIGATGTFVKIAGTTTASSLNQKFSTGTTQRATYTGAFTTNFRIVAFASMTSGNNQTLRMRVAKNGTTLAESNTLFKTTGSGEASAVGCQVIVSLAPTDYVELWVANDTAATNITVSDLNFTITRLN